MIGLVFAESRRKVAVKTAAEIGRTVTGIAKTGVFVNQPLAEVQQIARECRLDYVQLHGDEPPEYCRAVGVPVIKAFRIGPDFCSQAITAYQPNFLLFDSYVPGQAGGTGVPFNWQQTKELCGSVKIPVIIAGGLTPENVAEAIGILKPAGVDVSGGVETEGRKDAAKIMQFITAARRAQEANYA
jgi:phosphoribosylanthranilate isomerase